MISMATKRVTRFIRHGHTCLGVAGPASLTLTAGGRNNSLLWSRVSEENCGKMHTWSPYGQGKPTDGLPGFNGERGDPVSGIYHLGNGYRAYNPVLRRFNCPDSLSPFGAGGINPYAYCAGDPVNHTDPTGHISWQGIVGIVAGAVGLGLSLFTAGASISAAGGIAAAVNSATATALVVGGLGIAADVTGIASGATEDVNPHASSVLGWVSMATGIAGMAAGTALAIKKLLTSTDKNIVTWYTHPDNKFDSFYLVNKELGAFSRIRLELGRNDAFPFPAIAAYRKRFYGFSRKQLSPDDGLWAIQNGRLYHNGTALSTKPKPGYHVYDTSDMTHGLHLGNRIVHRNAAILPRGIQGIHLKSLALKSISALGENDSSVVAIVDINAPSEKALSESIIRMLNSGKSRYIV